MRIFLKLRFDLRRQTDPMWTNMSQQLGSPVNHLNLSETDIEKLLNSVTNVKSGLLFMTAKKNYDKKNLVTCIPEPSKYIRYMNVYICII